MGIHENIKKLREEQCLTLEEVGKRVGTTKQTIGRYESGEISNIPYDKITQLAKCFNVSPGYLMGWEEKKIQTPSFNEEHFILINLYEEVNEEHKKIIIDILKMFGESDKKER